MTDKNTTKVQEFSPVVAVVGHVDHGKTSLLDAIRKTTIAEREHGGITQKIGASSVEIMHEGTQRTITFIDTPGHEAFAKMRGRGALASDIGLLIVSAADGVMPQTKESIQVLKDSKIPYIVVITKIDLPDKNIEKVKQQLLREEVMLEGLGGDIPYIEVSARANTHIKELLELILLVAELNPKDPPVSPKDPFKAIVIESKLDQKTGPKATIIIKNGTVLTRDELFCEGTEARVRTLIDDKGKQLSTATIGDAVEILGFEKVPPVGGVVYKKSEMTIEKRDQMQLMVENPKEREVTFSMHNQIHTITLILCADTQGSLEAIIQALPEGIRLVSQKTGEISEADILLAKSIGALVLGFNTKIRAEVLRLAQTEKILLKNYAIIYEMIDEIHDVLEGKRISLEEKIFGKAKILARFPFEKSFAFGVLVIEGRIAKGDKIRILRGEDVLGETTIASLRQGKNAISKIEKGTEAGIVINPLLDITIGDMIVCHG